MSDSSDEGLTSDSSDAAPVSAEEISQLVLGLRGEAEGGTAAAQEVRAAYQAHGVPVCWQQGCSTKRAPPAACLQDACRQLSELSGLAAYVRAIAAAGAIPELVRLLGSTANEEVQLEAALALRNLADCNQVNQDAIRAAGAVPLLVPLLSNGGNEDLQLAAARALHDLAYGNPANPQAIAEGGGIQPLVDLLSSDNEDVQQAAANALSSLMTHPANREEIDAAGAREPLVSIMNHSSCWDVLFSAFQTLTSLDPAIAAVRAIPALVSLLGRLSEDDDQVADDQRAVANELARLAAEDRIYQQDIAGKHAIPLLVPLLVAGRGEDVQRAAVEALAKLAAGDDDNQNAIRDAGGIPPLVSLVGSTSPDAEQCPAAEALTELAAGNLSNQNAMAGAVPQLVSLLGSTEKKNVRRSTVAALHTLAAGHAGNQLAIVAAGGLPQLVEKMNNDSHWGVQLQALRLLAVLAPANRQAIVALGAVKKLKLTLRASRNEPVRGVAEQLRTLLELPDAAPGSAGAAGGRGKRRSSGGATPVPR